MPGRILTKILKVNAFTPELEKIKIAADILRKGGIVAFPTETVYGLGVNLNDEQALARVYEIKQRLAAKPITVHIASIEKIKELASSIPDFTFQLTNKFWPGPLTLILNSKEAGKTIAFRFPSHPVALKIIEESQSIIGATSANISDKPPAKSADEILAQFDGLIEMIVDSNGVEGVESTILDLTIFPPKIIREGLMAGKMKESLREVLKLKTKNIFLVCTGNSCRSPMAQRYLQHLLEKRSDMEINSAGVSAIYGMGATAEAIKVMAELGLDISGHFTQRLSDEMIEKADLILVMEKRHKNIILERRPKAAGKVFLLKEFGREGKFMDQEELDIPDPIGKSLEFYQKCFTILKQELERIAKIL